MGLSHDWGHRRGGEGRLLSWQLDLWPEGLIPSSFLLCSWPLLSFLPRSPVLVGSSSFKKNTAIRGSPRNFNLYRNWCLESEVSIARGQKKRKCISCLFIVPSNGGRGGELVLLGLLLGISSTHNDTNLTVQPAP